MFLSAQTAEYWPLTAGLGPFKHARGLVKVKEENEIHR